MQTENATKFIFRSLTPVINQPIPTYIPFPEKIISLDTTQGNHQMFLENYITFFCIKLSIYKAHVPFLQIFIRILRAHTHGVVSYVSVGCCIVFICLRGLRRGLGRISRENSGTSKELARLLAVAVLLRFYSGLWDGFVDWWLIGVALMALCCD